MRQWFLSYNSKELDLAHELKLALQRKDPNATIFVAPERLRAGTFWLPQLATAIAEATCFILLVGDSGLGQWQADEYYEARDRRVPVILLLLQGQAAPGLAMLRQLHWIITSNPASESTVAQLMDAADGVGARISELWRHTAPYRGLYAMTESDSDFFFGRGPETIDVVRALETFPERMPVLLGNSGVGKSSLARAGVVASLKRQAWPESPGQGGPWPRVFDDSRRWCFLNLTPGKEPLTALVEPFLQTWQLDPTSTLWAERRSEWVTALLHAKRTLSDLLDATERQYDRLQQPKPAAFFIYVDQGEELYLRVVDDRQRYRFSELLAQGITDPRLRALMSLRSDFLGKLQNDRPLYAVHHQISVPPLRESELREVISRPAAILSARFENEEFAADIARHTAEESVKDAGALPLLSYYLDDMWKEMVRRDDGVLRLPAHAIELGGVLVKRANDFLARNPGSEERLRRVFTIKLATVREDGEPTRRRAPRSEFSEDEWHLVTELADQPYRLLVTATSERGETYAEVAHEAIFKRWKKLHEWTLVQREFLLWRNDFLTARRRWQDTQSRDDALLAGLLLAQAQDWLAKRNGDFLDIDKEFVQLSRKRDSLERERRQGEALRRRVLAIAAVALAFVTVFAAFSIHQWVEAARERNATNLARSRLLAGLADQRLAEGDAGTAMLIAIEALPDADGGIDWPSAVEAEAALGNAWQRLQERVVLRGHDSRVMSAAFSPDGTRIMTASQDWTARLWDATTGKEIRIFGGHQGIVWGAALSPDGSRLVTASSDKHARLWEVGTGEVVKVLEGHKGIVTDAVFSRDGSRIATSSTDETARLWDAKSGEEIKVLRGHSDVVVSAVFSPDGASVLTASGDKTARLWNAQTGEQVTSLPHENWVTSAAFSNDGGYIVTTSDKLALVWDAKSGTKRMDLSGHEALVNRATFSPDGRYVVTASVDHTVRLWDVKNGKALMVLRGHVGEVWTAVFSPDGRRLVTASADGTARLWDAWSGLATTVLHGHEHRVRRAAFSPDGRRVVTASGDKTARLWDAKTGNEIKVLRGHEDYVSSAAFSPDGKRVVTASGDTTARLWDSETGERIRELRGHKDDVVSAAFSPDGARVVTASADKTARLWDSSTGQEIAVLRGHGQGGHDRIVLSAAFSPDGRKVVTASADLTVRIWDVETGEEIMAPLKGHSGFVSSAVFSPDGARLVTASGDGTARLWDIEARKEIMVLRGHDGYVRSAEFSPDGSFVVTASEDKTARLWSVKSGKEIVVLRGHPDVVWSAAFSQDGKRLVTSSQDGTAWIRSASAKLKLTDAKRVAPRCLTKGQREKLYLSDNPPTWCVDMQKWLDRQ